MRSRLIISLILAGLPLAAVQADTSLGTVPPGSDASSSLSAPSTADSLGPAASGNTGSSSADSGTLQPAGTSPLQSTSNDSSGMTAPTSPLQAPATGNDNLQVVMGDADGSTHNVAGSSNSPWSVVWWSLIVAVLAAGGYLLFRIVQRRRRTTRAHAGHPSHRAQPAEESGDIEPTSSQRLNITIDKPAAEVFEFVLNPKNTPAWISFIKSEESNEWPAHLGTIYKNTNEQGDESEFKLTEFKQDEMFVLSKTSNTYHVRYSVTPLEDGHTELEYYEWMDEGNLAQPFTSKELKTLKSAMEKAEKEAPADEKEKPAREV